MKLVVPTTITDASLLSSTLTEADNWVASTNYALKARVTRSTTHSIYERIVAGVSATAPENDFVNWVRVGPTNKWAMFDMATSSVSTASASITVSVNFSKTCVALLDVVGTDVTISVDSLDGATNYYSKTVSLLRTSPLLGTAANRRVLFLDGLPSSSTKKLTVTVSTYGGTASIGTMVVGTAYKFGDTDFGATTGIIDYSKKNVDDFGNITITKRNFAKTMTVPVQIPTSGIDDVQYMLSKYRAMACLYSASPDYDAMNILGFFKSFTLTAERAVTSTYSITVEGLT